MKDSGIGTPATRASIIERLIAVGYIEREGRALHATEKGIQVIRLLGEHPLTSPELTGDWEHRLGLIERGEDSRPAFMRDIAKFTDGDRRRAGQAQGRAGSSGPSSARARSAGARSTRTARATRAGRRRIPGCGFVIWKKKAGKNLPVSVAKELMASLKASIERGRRPAGRAGPRSRSRASGAARAATSGPSCRSSRARTSPASGGRASTRSGPSRAARGASEAAAGVADGRPPTRGGRPDAAAAADDGHRPSRRSKPLGQPGRQPARTRPGAP